MRGLAKTVRLMRDTLLILNRMKLYLETQSDCPYLKQSVEWEIQEIEKYICPTTSETMCIYHIDGNLSNNSPDNLDVQLLKEHQS